MAAKSGESIRLGIDIGGTFTDFVIFSKETGHIYSYKVLSTPQNPAYAVLNGLKQLGISNKIQIIHGSTVATNALLERKGAKTALITTQGFKDILSIGRQNRAALYDWTNPQPLPIVPPELCFEVSERVDCYGEIIKPLDKNDIEPIIHELIERGIQSVAVSLLFSFLHPEHEREISKILKSHKFPVSISSDILPEYREYERTSTTAVNAYVSPVLDYYLSTLQDNIPNAQLQVMQSNGGMISVNEARLNGVRCILSGPSGGIIGAKYLAELAYSEPLGERTDQEKTKLITFDMGGTSTDVSLIDSTTESNERVVGWGLSNRHPYFRHSHYRRRRRFNCLYRSGWRSKGRTSKRRSRSWTSLLWKRKFTNSDRCEYSIRSLGSRTLHVWGYQARPSTLLGLYS